jgi:hypothetical protein
MSNSEFISNFITDCTSKGIYSADDICNEAIKEIESCNDLLKKVDSIRSRKDNLMDVLRNFNHNSIKKLRTGKEDTVEILNEESEEFLNLMTQVCDKIDTCPPMKASGIIELLGGMEKQAQVYEAIKKLGVKGIIKRDDEAFFFKGENWEKRLYEKNS